MYKFIILNQADTVQIQPVGAPNETPRNTLLLIWPVVYRRNSTYDGAFRFRYFAVSTMIGIRLSRRRLVARRLIRCAAVMKVATVGFVVAIAIIVPARRWGSGGDERRIASTLSEFEVTSNRFLQVEHCGGGLGYLYHIQRVRDIWCNSHDQ